MQKKKQKWTEAILTYLKSTGSYYCLQSYQLGTCFLSIFVKTDLQSNIQNILTSKIILGSLGLYNKTAIGIRFQIFDTTICFICAHFSHGNANAERRNFEYQRIEREMTFQSENKAPVRPPSVRAPTILAANLIPQQSSELFHISDHDAVIWCGDFNYRIDLPNPESREKFHQRDFLLKYDQLLTGYKDKKVFVSYTEGEILFDPTYKFDVGTNDLDSSQKQRGPAWCDRIMFRTQTFSPAIQQLIYNSNPHLTYSDHQPVYSNFLFKPWKYHPLKIKKYQNQANTDKDTFKYQVVIEPSLIDFGTITFSEQKTANITIENNGQLPSIFNIQTEQQYLAVSPNKGVIYGGKKLKLLFRFKLPNQVKDMIILFIQTY